MIVRFHRLASRELRDAHAWYRQRDAVVAARYLTAFDDAIARVTTDPDSHPVERGHFRWVRVRRFPYRVIFERHGSDTIFIVALAHSRRRPGYWIRRR